MSIIMFTTVALTANSSHAALSAVRPILSNLLKTTAQISVSGVAMSSAIVHGCHACMGVMTASVLHFDIYAGLSCGAMLQAWHSFRSHRHEQAREHGMACIAHIIVALLQWHA